MKVIISFLFAVLIATTCLAQSFSSLSVFVSEDESSKPIAFASIIVKEAGWATKTTGNDGKAFFDKSMPIGEIHYIVSKEGYQGFEGTINITTEQKSNTLNVKLSKFRDDRLLITGEVVDGDDRDLEGAIVEVKVADIIRTAKTDASGNYKIELTLNRAQYDINTLKLEVKCKDGSGKKVETIDLTRRNVIYKDFKLNCGNIPPIETNKKYEDEDLLLIFNDCKRQGTNLVVTLTATAKKNDYELEIIGRNNTNKTKIFDNFGGEYTPFTIETGNKKNTGVTHPQTIVAGISTKVKLTFENFSSDAQSISLLDIGLYTPIPRSIVRIKIRNLPIK